MVYLNAPANMPLSVTKPKYNVFASSYILHIKLSSWQISGIFELQDKMTHHKFPKLAVRGLRFRQFAFHHLGCYVDEPRAFPCGFFFFDKQVWHQWEREGEIWTSEFIMRYGPQPMCYPLRLNFHVEVETYISIINLYCIAFDFAPQIFHWSYRINITVKFLKP